jgi:KDO2-lipid IV(A) lauroyltransferase
MMNIATKLRYMAEYAGLRLVIAIVRILPLERAVPISAAIWRTLGPYSKRRHKRALANLARAFPEKSAEERERIALAAWENLGRVMAETMQLDRILQQPERIEIANPEVLERYRGRMGALVCCSMHSGNWELATWPMAAADMKPAAVYRLVSNPYVDDYLRRQRSLLYPGGMFSRGGMRGGSRLAGANTARQLAVWLREGGRVGMLTDLYAKAGIEVPFFGHPAASSPMAAMLARRTGARLWIGRCVRIGKQSRFRVEMKELKVPFSEDRDADIRETTAAMQRQFEEWIREYPEQWMWSNRKWE